MLFIRNSTSVHNRERYTVTQNGHLEVNSAWMLPYLMQSSAEHLRIAKQ